MLKVQLLKRLLYHLSLSLSLCALCADCVGSVLKKKKKKDHWNLVREKKENQTGKCRAQRVEKMGSFTFFPYSQSEIFETQATIDGFAYFSL